MNFFELTTTMQANAFFQHSNLAELFGQIWNIGGLTFHARQDLMSTLLKGSLTEEEQATIDRILHAVRRGWLRVLD